MHKEIIGKTEFVFKMVTSPEILKEVFRLRYQVYCNECNFIKAEDYPEGIEKDKYDPYSLHFVAQDQNGIIGAARLVLDSSLGFPLEEHCNGSLDINKSTVSRNSMGEISRLVISKEYRRRRGDDLYYTSEYDDKVPYSHTENIMTRVRPMAFGLYREIYQESKRRGITHWYALMEKSLWLLLRLHNFVFQVIGKEIDFYGPVSPYLARIEEVEHNVFQKFPNLIKYFIDGLEEKYLPQVILQQNPSNE